MNSRPDADAIDTRARSLIAFLEFTLPHVSDTARHLIECRHTNQGVRALPTFRHRFGKMFDAYRKWLGIPPKDQPPNHYRLLGVELFEDDMDVIEGAADRQMAFIRQYQSGEHATEAANILNELATARLCLLKPATKTAYDAKLRQQLAPAESPAFDMMLNVDDFKPLSRPAKRTKPTRKSSSTGGPKPLVIASGIAAAVIAIAAVAFSIGRPKQPIEVPATAKQLVPTDSTPSKSDQSGAVSDAPNVRRPVSTADSTLSAESLGSSIDLLKQIDLKRDAIAGEWQQTTSSLIGGFHGRLFVPGKLPDDYQVTFTVRAAEGTDTMALGFMMAGRQGMIVLDGWSGTVSGLYLDGLEPNNNSNSASFRGRLFSNALSKIVVTVHPGHLNVTVDNRKVFNWYGNPERLFVPSGYGMGCRESLVIATLQCKYIFESATLNPIKPEPALPSLPRLDRNVDVISLIDLNRDVSQGTWRIQKNVLVSPDLDAKISLPVRVPDEYSLSAMVKLPADSRGDPTLIVGLPWSGTQCQIVLKNDECLGIEMIDGNRFLHNPSRRTGTYLKPGVSARMDCTVTKTGIRMEIDGRTLIDWRGEPWRVTTTGDWICSDSRRLSLGTKCHFHFHDIQVGPPLQPPPLPEHPALSIGNPIDLLRLVDPDRDRLNGSWEKTGDSLRIPAERGLNRLAIPFEMPVEYKLNMRVAREEEGERQLQVTLPFGNSQAVFLFDSRSRSGMFLDYQHAENNVTTYEKPVVLPTEPTDLTFFVRRTGMTVVRGDETIIKWEGNPDRTTWHHDLTAPGQRIVLGSWNQRFRFEKLTIEALEPSKFPDATPLGLDGKLLPMIDVVRDSRIGDWKQDPSGVTSPAVSAARLNLPVSVPAHYVLSTKIQRMSGDRQVWLGLVVGGYPCAIVLDDEQGQGVGIELLDGRRNDTTNWTFRKYAPPLFPQQKSVLVRCFVSPDSIVVSCDDKEVVRWHGDPRRLSSLRETTPPNCSATDRNSLWLGTWESSFTFRDIEMKPLEHSEAAALTESFSDEVFPMTPQIEAPFTTVRNDVQVTKPSIDDMPSTTTESDITASQSPTPAKKGEWIDLLKWSEGLDWSSSGVNWNDHLASKSTRNGIRMKSSPVARFPLPAIIDGEYEMEIEFKRQTGTEAIAIFFPIATHTMRMLLGVDAGKQSHIAFVNGKEYGNRPAQITNSKQHRVFIRVRAGGDKAAFNVDLDNFKDYFKWEGNPVDLMNRDLGAWSTSMFQRPWVGSDNSDVSFQKIRIRMLSGTIRRGLISNVDRERDLKNGTVRLVGEKPKTASAKHWRFLFNQTPLELAGEGPECRWPLVTRDFRFCDDYYVAHAPSTVTCPIPSGAKSFSVIGYNDASRHAKFLVRVDGNQIHDSKETGVAVIKVDLSVNASLLELVADPTEVKEYDHTAWCYPRFHAVAANRITDEMLDEKEGPLKFTITSATAESGVKNHQPFGEGYSAPVHFRDAMPCDEFLFGHAPSTVTYEVPPNMHRFSAIGYNVLSHSVKYEVWADAKRIFESPLAGITKIDVALPNDTKTIELRVNPVEGEYADQSIWCFPRLHRN